MIFTCIDPDMITKYHVLINGTVVKLTNDCLHTSVKIQGLLILTRHPQCASPSRGNVKGVKESPHRRAINVDLIFGWTSILCCGLDVYEIARLSSE